MVLCVWVGVKVSVCNMKNEGMYEVGDDVCGGIGFFVGGICLD